MSYHTLFFLLFCSTLGYSNPPDLSQLKLEFVQAIWRHGERAALSDLYPVFEANWTFGGGGFGELTPRGMAQMDEFGALIRKRYVAEQLFLTQRFKANQIHIRSTDVNRTILSAQSLLYGLYPPGDWNVAGLDYPATDFWQPGFTFISVHVDGKDKCATSQTCDCPRISELLTTMQKLPEVQEAMKKIFALNRQVAGYYNISKDADQFMTYADAWKCQRAYFNDSMYRQLPFYTEQLYTTAQTTYAPYKGFIQGYFKLRALRAGPLLNELYQRALEKFECSQSPGTCGGYLRAMKFYGYSMHDNNVYSTLVVLGLQNLTGTLDGWPDYASGIVFEFFRNSTSNERFFKVLHRAKTGQDLQEVTEMIANCDGSTFCPFSAFQKLADMYRPVPDYQKACLATTSSSKINVFAVFLCIFVLVQ
ncbi:unnamed protein product [Caenorhabditis sp. 36 PRJEB53466]|nr:unnamed protein product [Caenorhabditis sp. 36 PRJEB53466]